MLQLTIIPLILYNTQLECKILNDRHYAQI